jgi:hypothetical protein
MRGFFSDMVILFLSEDTVGNEDGQNAKRKTQTKNSAPAATPPTGTGGESSKLSDVTYCGWLDGPRAFVCVERIKKLLDRFGQLATVVEDSTVSFRDLAPRPYVPSIRRRRIVAMRSVLH